MDKSNLMNWVWVARFFKISCMLKYFEQWFSTNTKSLWEISFLITSSMIGLPFLTFHCKLLLLKLTQSVTIEKFVSKQRKGKRSLHFVLISLFQRQRNLFLLIHISFSMVCNFLVLEAWLCESLEGLLLFYGFSL